MAKKKGSQPTDAFKQIDIALLLRPFVTSQVRLSAFLQSYSPSNYRKLKTETDIGKACQLVTSPITGRRTDWTSDAPSQSSR
jgi:hypothetical protein